MCTLKPSYFGLENCVPRRHRKAKNHNHYIHTAHQTKNSFKGRAGDEVQAQKLSQSSGNEVLGSTPKKATMKEKSLEVF